MDDRKFLDHINAKILKEANGNHDGSNPKALNATLADDTFLRLLGAFEFFLQRTQVMQVTALKQTGHSSFTCFQSPAVERLRVSFILAFIIAALWPKTLLYEE